MVEQKLKRAVVYTPSGAIEFGSDKTLIVDGPKRILQHVRSDGGITGYYGFPMLIESDPTLIAMPTIPIIGPRNDAA